jgi:CDGSH-type Zn-finger protein
MTRITTGKNGPLRVEGDFELYDANGNRYGLGGRTVVALCRCGQSANRPFCDGSHGRTGFTCDAPARDLPPRT